MDGSRLDEFQATIDQARMQHDEHEAGARGIQTLLSHPDPPTAIITVNDFTAIGALHEAKKLGLRIPEDLSIVGFGDIPIASMTDPPLATVRAPYKRVGEILTKLTVMLIEGKPLVKKNFSFPVEFIERCSTCKPKVRLSKGGERNLIKKI